MKSHLKAKSLIYLLLIIGIGSGWIWISRPSQDLMSNSDALPQENFLAPDFTLQSSSDETVSLSDFRGGPVIINFWASWCPPCQKEMPDFSEAQLEYADQGVTILAVNAFHRDSITGLNAFLKNNPVSFQILLDEIGSVNKMYQVHSLPTTFFIDADGYIRKIIIGGPIPLSLIRIETDQLLGY
jgi:peroxiredoxin